MHIFNLSLTQQYFPAAWKEAAVVPVFKIGINSAVSNYRPISILNNFSNLFEFIVHDHVLHYTKLSPNQRGFAKSKSTLSDNFRCAARLTSGAFTFQRIHVTLITIVNF
jgi:hypothetical protein